MDLQCIQVSGLKSISVRNVTGDSNLICQAKCHLDKKCQNDVLIGNMNMDVFIYIFKLKFLYKNTCSPMTAWIHIGLL